MTNTKNRNMYNEALDFELELENILNQKTLYILGIPSQLSLVNLFDFGQFILFLKNQYLKPEYVKSILKKDANISNERL